jgi:hypothetical protein
MTADDEPLSVERACSEIGMLLDDGDAPWLGDDESIRVPGSPGLRFIELKLVDRLLKAAVEPELAFVVANDGQRMT